MGSPSNPAQLLASSEFSSSICNLSSQSYLSHPFRLNVLHGRSQRLSLGFNRFKASPVAVNGRPSRYRNNKKDIRGGKSPVSRKKENPWSDSHAEFTKGSTFKSREQSPVQTKQRRTQKSLSESSNVTQFEGPSVLTSAVMPVETEKVLQTQEPSSTPSWQTFVSSLCGVWRGVGAAFSPSTAEMEAIALGDKNELLYDCRVLSTVDEVYADNKSYIERKTVWAVGNPLGEQSKGELQTQNSLLSEDYKSEDEIEGSYVENEDDIYMEGRLEADDVDAGLQEFSEPKITADLESEDLKYDTVMEDDFLDLEPGLVFFEDGSYSRGPLELLTGDPNDISHTYKIEQCLVRGGHTRLRLVHTISVEEEGEEVQLLRVAVYEEEWMGPRNMKFISDTGGHHLPLFSERPRLEQKELAGIWKVFEVSATPVFHDDIEMVSTNERPPYVYMTLETQKRRHLPEVPVQFSDEDILDVQDVTVMWLPGGVNAYVDINANGILTIGVGWYEDGVNLVMERDYNQDGQLCDIRSKTEIKGGWVGGRM